MAERDSSRPLIEMRHVEKSYGSDRVLAIDELVLAEGDQLLVTGNNGSGKTTLLKLCAGIVPIDRGRGTLSRSPAIAGSAGGYVPQSGGLYPNLTIRENIALRRRVYGLSAAAGPDAGRFVRALGLEELANRRFANLSGGYQRLASIAVSLEMSPVWLMLDEPFSGVDLTNRGALEAVLADAARTLRLLVVTTPEVETLQFVNRNIQLERGRIV